MKKILFAFIFLLWFLLFGFIFIVPAFAEGEFSTRYNIIYDVDQSGTSVIYEVNVINLTTRYYVSQYDLIVPSTKIQEIKASDRKGQIIPKVNQEENSTRIHLVFNDKVVGIGNVLAFSLSYRSTEIAQKNGRIWEINLPQKTDNPEIIEYNVHLKVPQSFGEPAYLFPKPSSPMSWTKDQLGGGVTAAFGDYQLFGFNLSYHLTNPKIFPVYTEIVLPSDNPYQRVKFSEIKPKPVNVRQDEDGNWLARYDLSSQDKLNVEASGLVKILPFAEFEYPQKEDKLKQYLAEQKYWEVKDDTIKKLAEELKTPKAIYDYIVSLLKYDYPKAQSGGQRIGAKEVLKNPQKAICMEFTDLFITLARAAGIPAREVDGFAYTTNYKLRPLSAGRDILHAWPEYWDKERKVWVMVDPTWEVTTGGMNYFDKLDFNHFALVTKGLSSELPLPAGAYKLTEGQGKDVDVEFTFTDWPQTNPQYEITWNLPKWLISRLEFENYSMQIKNIASIAGYAKEIKVDSSPSGLLKNEPSDLFLAPSETYKLNFNFRKLGLFESFNGSLFVTIDGKTFTKPLTITPLGWIIVGIIVLFVFITLSIIFIIKKIRRVRSQPKIDNEQTTN